MDSIRDRVQDLRDLLDGRVPIETKRSYSWDLDWQYIGLAGLTLSEGVTLHRDIVLRPTFADMFSAPMVAFAAPPNARAPHPAPWVPVRMAANCDVRAELVFPPKATFPDISREQSIWLVAALVRLFASVPVTNVFSVNVPIADIPGRPNDAHLIALEPFVPRVGSWIGQTVHASTEALEHLSHSIGSACRLLVDDRFARAFLFYDQASKTGNLSAATMLLWTAIETVFALGSGPGKGKKLARAFADFLPSSQNGSVNRELLKAHVTEGYRDRGHVTHGAHEPSQSRFVADCILAGALFNTILARGQMPKPKT